MDQKLERPTDGELVSAAILTLASVCLPKPKDEKATEDQHVWEIFNYFLRDIILKDIPEPAD